jgi:hypothetical protein
MTREYVNVTLTARVDGDRLLLLDSSGKPIRVIHVDQAKPLDVADVASIELRHTWCSAVAGMIGAHINASERHKRSGWDAKISVWVVSLRHRRNRTRPVRVRRFPPRAKYRCQTWDERLDCLTQQHANWKRKCEQRRNNPWSLWAETVSGNLRKREYVNADSDTVSQQTQPRAKAERPIIQMRIDWGDATPRSVFA